jgi:hypothetical protein
MRISWSMVAVGVGVLFVAGCACWVRRREVHDDPPSSDGKMNSAVKWFGKVIGTKREIELALSNLDGELHDASKTKSQQSASHSWTTPTPTPNTLSTDVHVANPPLRNYTNVHFVNLPLRDCGMQNVAFSLWL